MTRENNQWTRRSLLKATALATPAVASVLVAPGLSAESILGADDSGSRSRLRTASHQEPSGAAVRVASGTGVLPNDRGQVWREYDIRPYTSRVNSTAKPEQAIVDWILRDTGTDRWFSQPLGLLCASRDILRVYHTPEVQAIVTEIVNRFIRDESEAHVFSLGLVTVGSPNWRSKSYHVLRPVSVQTPGVEAWLLSKEDAAILAADLRKRSDCVEHNSPNIMISNGQTQSLTQTRPLPYIRSVRLRSGGWPSHELEMGQVEEGYWLQFSPLLTADKESVDAVLKFDMFQVEKLATVWINVPTAVDPRQRTQVQVPQTSSWRLHERFRWPVDQVLLISCGLVASPGPAQTATGSIKAVLSPGPPRSDALLFLQSKGPTTKTPASQGAKLRTSDAKYRGRY